MRRHTHRPRHGEHLPVLLQGVTRGDERAAVVGGLDHDGAAREPADDAVAAREVELERRRPAGELTHQRALARDGSGQLAMPLGIDAVDARAEDRDRPAASREGGMVGRGVDAGGEPAHHRDAGLRELARQLRGHVPPVFARPARADDRDRRLVGPPQAAAHRQHERGLGDVAQRGRIRVVAPGHQRGARPGELQRLGARAPGGRAERGDHGRRHVGRGERAGGRIEDGARRPEALDEREGAARQQLGHQREREPRERGVVERHRVRRGSHAETKRLLYPSRRCKSPRTFARSHGARRTRARTLTGRRRAADRWSRGTSCRRRTCRRRSSCSRAAHPPRGGR